jgi:hypothetical protein
MLCTVAIEHTAFFELFRNLPEMKPVDGIGYGKRKKPRLSDENPEEELQEGKPLFTDHSQEE